MDFKIVLKYNNIQGDAMKEIDFVVWQEGEYFVSQCLNVNVSSFGDSIEDSIKNIKEAVELYFEDEPNLQMPKIEKMFLGREIINA